MCPIMTIIYILLLLIFLVVNTSHFYLSLKIKILTIEKLTIMKITQFKIKIGYN